MEEWKTENIQMRTMWDKGKSYCMKLVYDVQKSYM